VIVARDENTLVVLDTLSKTVEEFHEGLSVDLPDEYPVDLRRCAADLKGEIDNTIMRIFRQDFNRKTAKTRISKCNKYYVIRSKIQEELKTLRKELQTFRNATRGTAARDSAKKLQQEINSIEKEEWVMGEVAEESKEESSGFWSWSWCCGKRRRLLEAGTSTESWFRQTRAYDR